MVTLGAGIGHALAALIREETGLQARHLKPDTIQRSFMACVSSTDQSEAHVVGREAVRAAVGGESGKMVALRRVPGQRTCDTELVPLENVANVRKQMPDDFIRENGDFVTEAFYDYAAPLIGEPLPEYARLKMIAVAAS